MSAIYNTQGRFCPPTKEMDMKTIKKVAPVSNGYWVVTYSDGTEKDYNPWVDVDFDVENLIQPFREAASRNVRIAR